jgi:prepilin-type N-terminal cleavage/methylation domain-containing protein
LYSIKGIEMKTASQFSHPIRGLTLLEVLVVIAIIVFLAMLLIPAMSHRGPARVTLCLNNGRQQTLALVIYAQDNNDRLPVNPVLTNSARLALCPWTLDADVANKLIANGPQPMNFYDPGTEPTFGPVDWFGSVPYGPVPGGTPSLWTYSASYPLSNAVAGQSGYRVTGYAQTLPGNPCYGTPGMSVFTNMNLKLSTDTNANPSQKIVIACANFTDTPEGAVAHGVPAASDDYNVFKNYTWTGHNSFGEKYNGAIKPFISAHLAGGKTPSGANEAMMDGHVEWRLFQNMINRTASGPFFYY